jgi:hypothetical protein
MEKPSTNRLQSLKYARPYSWMAYISTYCFFV